MTKVANPARHDAGRPVQPQDNFAAGMGEPDQDLGVGDLDVAVFVDLAVDLDGLAGTYDRRAVHPG